MAIRQQARVRFRLSNGQECVVDEHGIARVPGIRDAPQLNLEEELANVPQVQLESVGVAGKGVVQILLRGDLEKLVSNRAVTPADEHDD